MKKTFCKWGAVAAAITALVLVFAACQQPTEEESSGSGQTTTLRLWYNTDSNLQIMSGDRFVITLFKKNAETKTKMKNGSTPGVDSLEDALMGDPMNATNNKYLEVLNTIEQDITDAHLTRTSKGNYLDLLIVDKTPLATPVNGILNTKNEIWQGSGSYYLALSVAPANGATYGDLTNISPNVIPAVTGGRISNKPFDSVPPSSFGSTGSGKNYFIYCPDKLDRNEQNKIAATPKQFNVNVKTVSITNGINDIYLRNFINF